MADRVLAEFADAGALAAAIRALRERGYRGLEAYLPYAVTDVEEALAAPRSRLPVAVFVVGLLAAAGTYGLQWFLVAWNYPLVVGGRPPHFPLTFVPITFEMGVLFASFTAFFGVLALGRLVRLIDGVQGTPGFESVTGDRFWLEVRTGEGRSDAERTREELIALGATRVELAGARPAAPAGEGAS